MLATFTRRGSRKTSRGDGGQTLLEFALLLPVVLLFLFAIVDFGIAMDRRLVLQHAVREGARYAALSVDEAFICDRTLAQAQGVIAAEDITISYDDMDHNGTRTDAGDAVNVRADFTYGFPIVRDFAEAAGISGFSIHMDPVGSSRLERQHPEEFGPTCA